jgi:hypothetical protein
MSKSSHRCESQRAQAPQASVAVLKEKFCLEKYPALAEALDAMCAFPHELNRRISSFRLAKSIEGDAMLVRFDKPGCHEPWRLDSSSRGQDNGFRVSFVYYFEDSTNNNGCDLVLKRDDDSKQSEPQHISSKVDRIVLYRSDKMLRSMTAFQPGGTSTCMSMMTFYIRTAT